MTVAQLAPLARTTFDLPRTLEATTPPEARGMDRDEVRLLVARPTGLRHRRFRGIADELDPGDLVVVNTSPTMPGALDGRIAGRDVTVHLSTRRHEPDATTWEVELRRPDGSGPVLDATARTTVDLDAGGTVRLLAPADERPDGTRMWQARLDVPGDVGAHLAAHGRPISYAHAPGTTPLHAHQTAVARLPLRLDGGDDVANGASAEMASAGRPITPLVLTALLRAGILVAGVTLHAGVGSLDDHEPPRPEPFAVPRATADLVTATRRRGRRVVAVGTTVTRALESAAGTDGTVTAARGWTDLVIGPHRPVRVVDGLVTGWHAPRASHLLVLEAVAGTSLVQAAYAAALDHGYLWHEFGDSCLFLPA